MRSIPSLFAIIITAILLPNLASSQEITQSKASLVLSVMAEGIGDLSFASPEWVEAAQEALTAAAATHADGLKDLGEFTFCQVAHNAPAYLHNGATFSWYVKFDGAKVEAHTGELPASECDLKIEGDHSIMSNLAHIQYDGNDPVIVAAAQARLRKVSRWETHGAMPEHKVLRAVLRSVHDTMAERTYPRFVWMSPEWVEIARYLVTTRAKLPEYAKDLVDVEYRFCEMFTDGPRFVFPDGADSGFWVVCNYGEMSVGFGWLPKSYGPADYLNVGLFTPVLPLGRTVKAAMTEEENAEQGVYAAAAFRRDPEDTSDSEKKYPQINKPFPEALSGVMSVLHDELSKRTTGELVSDYVDGVKPEWAAPLKLDRADGYDASWLLYDQFDIYGDALK